MTLRDVASGFPSSKKPEHVLTASDVVVGGGKIHLIADAILDILKRLGGVFQRGSQLVRIAAGVVPTVRGVIRDEKALSVVPLTAHWLMSRATRAGSFWKFDARSNGYKPADAPETACKIVLQSYGSWGLPALTGITTGPTLRLPSGSVISKSGYDKETGLWADFDPKDFPVIPEKPSRLDAKHAIEILSDIIKEFPFKEESDKSAALSALITAPLRRVLPEAPLFAFDATRQGTGKTLFAEICGIVATGTLPTVVSFTGDPDEERKKLVSILVAGDSAVVLDNVQHELQGGALSAMLTGESFSDRLLGGNEIGRCATNAFWMTTGNNLSFDSDLSQRVVLVRLDALSEAPEERTFKIPDIRTYVRDHRAELLNAALTVVKAYISAGCPAQKIKPWQRFPMWSETIRAALVWIGAGDPRANAQAIAKNDAEKMQLTALLHAWRAAFTSTGTTVADAVKHSGYGDATGAAALRDVFTEIAGVPGGGFSNRKIGKFISAHEGRIESKLRFARGGEHERTRWIAEKVDLPRKNPDGFDDFDGLPLRRAETVKSTSDSSYGGNAAIPQNRQNRQESGPLCPECGEPYDPESPCGSCAAAAPGGVQ